MHSRGLATHGQSPTGIKLGTRDVVRVGHLRISSVLPVTAAATGRSAFRIAVLVLIALMAHSAGCARRFPETEVTPIKVDTPAELQRYLLSRKPDVAQFRLRGPFAVTERRDLAIPVASDLTVAADLYLCAAARKAPLIIVLHGLDNSKADHAFQAMHLASWGMHGMAIDLPKRGPWIANGRSLARLVDAIHRTPQLVDDRIDTDKIILVGHSFGATSLACFWIPPGSAGNCGSCCSGSPFR